MFCPHPCAHSGSEVIFDRIAFAGASWKPLLQLRDAWAAEASVWLNQRGQLKNAFERELEAARAAEARAEAFGRGGRGDGNEPPAKRMRVRSAQVTKAHHPGSLTVQPGDVCFFIAACTQPLWSRVKMESDGRIGIISASKLEEVPEEAPQMEPMLPPSDDEMLPPSDDEDARMAADDAASEEVADVQFVERVQAADAAAVEAEAAAQQGAAEECGYGGD